MKTFFTALIVCVASVSGAWAQSVSYTEKIVNPSFETSSLFGWESKGFQSQTNNTPSEKAGWDKDGTRYAEMWTNGGSKLANGSISQKVTDLPDGDYRVYMRGHAIQQADSLLVCKGAYLFTPFDRTLVNAGGEYTTTGIVAEGFLTIGYMTEGTDANWVACDDFRIERTGESTDSYLRYLQTTVAELREFFDMADGRPADYNKDEIESALALAASATDKVSVKSALAALRAAEAKLVELRHEYKVGAYPAGRMSSEIRIARMLYADSDYPGKTAYLAAIEAAEAVYADAANGAEQYDAAIAELKQAKATYLAGRPSQWVRISNGAAWRDSDGNTVQAHGAGFLQLNDRFYMIGEDRSRSWNPDVNMYSSKDLVNWDFECKIIANKVTHPDLGSSRMIERPKLMYNPLTGKFVVWCHWEASNYGASEAGVFYSDVVNEPYTYYSGERPLGIKSRDCNVYVDDDGTAYFISTTSENTNLGLFKLSEDYLEPVEHTVLFSGQKREAPAIVRHDGRYYMLSSACSGWDPNTCKLSTTTDLKSGWSGLKSVGNPIAFDTQAASILKIEGTESTTFLYVGDRWQDPALPESKTIIFPIELADGKCTYNYVPEFEINFVTGEWRTVSREDALDRTGWTVADCSTEELDGENGAAANVLDGDGTTKWHTRYKGEAGVAPHHITIDMGAEREVGSVRAVPRQDNGSTNGLIRAYALQAGNDGEHWTTISGGSWLPYWGEIYFKPIKTRYLRLVSVEGNYASMSEFEVFAPASLPYPDVSLSTNIGTGSHTSTGQTIEATEGQTLNFATTADAAGGSWVLECPDGTFLSGSKVTIEDVKASHSGTYTAHFLDLYNTSHSTSYQVQVKGAGADSATATATLVSRRYYTVLGVATNADAPGIKIVVETYTDGSIHTLKQAN